MPTLQQSPGQVLDKVTDINPKSPRHKSRRRLSWFVSATSPRTCPRVCHGLCRKHLDMSKWFVSTQLSWFVSTTFTKTSWFHDLSPFVSTTFPAGKFQWKSA